MINRSHTDSASVGDSFSKLLELGLPLAHGVSVVDLLTTVLNINLNKSNVVNVTESLSADFSKSLTDTATITEAISLTYDPSFSHSVTASESFSTLFISGTPSLFNNSTMNTSTFNG